MNELVQALDHGLELGSREELKFVEEEDHAPLTIGSGLTDGHEEVGEVQGKIAVIRYAFCGVNAQPGLPPALRINLNREGREHAGGATDCVAPPRPG